MLSYVKSKLSVLLKFSAINRLRGVPFPTFKGEAAQLEISRLLLCGKPVIVARVGETEGAAASFYLKNRVTRGSCKLPYPDELKSRLKLLAGYFPITDLSIDVLASSYLKAIEDIDMHAVWTPHDAVLKPNSLKSCRLIDIDPFFTKRKWTQSLVGLKVCVVSPFVDSMKEQYKRREVLFKDEVLPDFQLFFSRAPMTHCESDVDGQDWFENKRKLVESVAAHRPDIVIIGAGAYGLPVAADLKQLGISSVVMGGSTQLLFGLRGTRWENDRQYARLMTDAWVRPAKTERPDGFGDFEIKGGAYW
jgi:hypothetical protein